MADVNTLVDQLSALTVIEAANLVKQLEEKWGVSAAALNCVAPRLGVVVRATPSISVDTTENKSLPADAIPGADACKSVFDGNWGS